MKRTILLSLMVAAPALGAAACTSDTAGSGVDNLASSDATFLELSFEGRVIMASPGEDETQLHKGVETQLFYLAGELDKQHGAHGRFGFVELSNVTREPYDVGLELVHYEAKLSVAWPGGSEMPESYPIVVPLRVDPEGLDAFNDEYVHACVPSGHSKYGVDYVWYDFQPVATGCELDPDHVVETVATVAESPYITTDRYPEYPRFWDDGAFRVVLVHGTHGANSLDPDDGLVQEYLSIQDTLVQMFPGAEVTQADLRPQIYDDWTLRTSVPAYGGGTGELTITTLLTAPLKYIGEDFDARFDELTPDADLVIYGGHSGLSKNIKAIAQKGVVTPQHYQVFMLHGCSTFAYLDRSITDRRIAVNGAEIDPNGTRYLDLVVTAQPSYFWANTPAITGVIGFLTDDEPHSYLEILDRMPTHEMAVVAGEEDNPSEAP